MDIKTLRKFCKSLPYVTGEIKWGNDLCFMIGEKMFCITSPDAPLRVSLKVTDEEFDEMSGLPGIVPLRMSPGINGYVLKK